MQNDSIIIVNVNDVYYHIDKMLEDKKVKHSRDFRDYIIRRAVVMIIENLGGINSSPSLKNVYLDSYSKYVHDMLYSYVLAGLNKCKIHISPVTGYYVNTLTVNDSLHIVISRT